MKQRRMCTAMRGAKCNRLNFETLDGDSTM